MKIVINGSTYTVFDSLGFNPETDLTNNSLPINEFQARLFTNAQINYGQWAELKDDNDNLWAKYWLSYAERIGRDDDRQTYVVKIIGESPLSLLGRAKMPIKFYTSGTTAKDAITEILSYVNIGSFSDVVDDSSLRSTLDSISVTGFAPEQSARERLQWVLLLTGCYVTSYFGSHFHIKSISTSGGEVIPPEKTFWKPSISHRDYVTKIIVHAYSFTQDYPAPDDNYVTDGTNYWIVTETVVSLTNSNAPSGAPENIIEIDECMFISPYNASTIVYNLAAYYFDRTEIEADVINNGSYKPGDRVTVYLDEDSLVTGYIDQCSFKFGLQARSGLHLTAAEPVEGASLIIKYRWGTAYIAQRRYFLPKGHVYSITTEYLDITLNGHRYVFRPTQNVITGTLTENSTVNVTCEIALDSFAITTTIRQDAINDKNLLIKWLNEARLSGRDAVIEMLNNVYAENMATMSNTAQVVHVLSVDGLEKSVTSTDKTIYINGDHRIDGHNDGE